MRKIFLILIILFLVAVSSAYATTNDAIIYYSFDDTNISSGNPLDISGYGNDGTSVNTPTTGHTGKIGEAFHFTTASSQYIDTNYGDALSISDFTVAFWVKYNDSNTQMFMGARKDGNDNTQFYNTGTGTINFYEERNNIAKSGSDAGAYNDNVWHFICHSSTEGGNIDTYIDGTDYNTDVATSADWDMIDMFLAARNNAGSADNYYFGYMDEFAFFNRSLSSAECEDLRTQTSNPYAGGGSPPAPSANDTIFYIDAIDIWTSNNISSYNATFGGITQSLIGHPSALNITNQFSRFGNTYGFQLNGSDTGTNKSTPEFTSAVVGLGLALNGSGAFETDLDASDFEGDENAISISAWVFADTDHAGEYELFGNTNNPSISNWGLCYYVKTNGNLKGANGDGGYDTGFNISNKLVNIIFTYNSTDDEFKTYINGTLIHNTTTTDPVDTGSNSFTAGNCDSGAYAQFEDGSYIDQFWLFNKTLSLQEVDEVFENSKNSYTVPELTNITFSANNYFNKSFTNWNVSENLTANMTQAIISFNVTEIVTGNPILGNITIDGIEKLSNQTFNITSGSYSVLFENASYFAQNTSITVTALTSETFDIVVGDSILNISAKDGATNATITTYTVNIQNGSYSQNFSTTNGSIFAPLKKDYYYTITLLSDTFSNYSNTTLVNQTLQDEELTFYTFNAVSITFRDQQTQQLLSGLNITVDFISQPYSVRNYTSTGSFFIDLLTPTAYQIRYNAQGYAESSYYFTLVNQTSTILTLYMINTSVVQNVTISVYTQDGDPLENAIVKVLKFSPVINSYFTAEILGTNFAGEAVAPLEIGSEYYYFIVEYPTGTIVKTTNPTYIYNTEISLTVILDSPIGNRFFQTNEVSHELVFNNVTNNFRFTFTDATNSLTKGCLKVYRINGLTSTLYNNTCANGANGVLLGGVDNVTGATYRADAFIYYNTTDVLLDSRFKTFYADNDFNQFGLFIVAILTMVFALLGIWNPIVATLLAPIPLILGNLIGIIQLEWDIVIGVIVMALVIVWLIRRKS